MISENILGSSDELTELLSRKVHDSWLESRKKAGWTYGPARSDELRQSPCMIPYDELTEAEREYDRCTVFTVLDTLVKLGYRIPGRSPQ